MSATHACDEINKYLPEIIEVDNMKGIAQIEKYPHPI